MENPALLLTGQRSPRHRDVRSVASEVLLPEAGYADWLGLTPQGEIVLTEVKLGGNVEARREIVAQALDYYTALRRMSFEELEAACRNGQPSALTDDMGLFEVSGAKDSSLTFDEFRASVDHNLRTGSVLLVLALDRAPKSLVRLVAEALADQPALPFSVSVVEIATYEANDGGLLLAPMLRGDIVATSRAVVRLEGTLVAAETREPDPSARVAMSTLERRADYMAAVAATDPTLPGRLEGFLEKAGHLGVQVETPRSLVLRIDGVNVGTISRKGGVEVYKTGPAREAGLPAFDAYQRALTVATGKPLQGGTGGEPVFRAHIDALLQHEAAWLAALKNYADDMRAEAVDAGGAA